MRFHFCLEWMHCGLSFSAGGALVTFLPRSRQRSNERSRRFKSGVGFGAVGRSGFVYWVYGADEPTILMTSQDKFASPKEHSEQSQGEDRDPSIPTFPSMMSSQERRELGGEGESHSNPPLMMG